MNPRPPVVEIIDPQMVRCLQNQTPAQRLATAFAMWESARILIRGAVRTQHVDWNEEQVNREVARRLSHGATENVRR